jgi:chromosome segregation ATPase
MSLSGMLSEARSSYDTLRTEFYQVERKATALEAEVERLREDLELSRETRRGLESNRLELTDELNARNAQIAELERQLAHESTQRRAVGEARRALQEQFDIAEKRMIGLEGELAAAREKLALLEDEKRSLQIAVDQALNETARLTRRLTESENMLTATRAQLGKVEASFAEAYAERGRLAAVLDEAKEQHQTERSSLNMRLDALQCRAATAERLLSETRQNLIARTEEVRAFDRKSVEATIARNNSEKRLAQIELQHETRERQIKDHEQARIALTERNNALAKTLKVRETALARFEESVRIDRAQWPPGGGHTGQPHQHRKAGRGSQFRPTARTNGAGRCRGRTGGRAQG